MGFAFVAVIPLRFFRWLAGASETNTIFLREPVALVRLPF
jgi:hypothetical protein